jgi:hypothetical protein
MQLDMTSEQAADLLDTLDSTVRELSHEIADTDNPRYRSELSARRDRLGSLLEELRSSVS